MTFLNYKNNVLHFEDVSLDDISEAVGTPTYVYSQSVLENNFNKIDIALQKKIGKNQQKLIAFSETGTGS